MSERISRAPKVLIVSNQQTTGPLWVFSLQQQKLNVLLESNPAQAVRRCELDAPDLIILDKNPLESLRNTNTVNKVMKNGRLYDGNTLDEVYPIKRKAPSFELEQASPGALPGVR